VAAHFVVMSDMHLGYDRSVWSDPRAYDRVAEAVADLCGGATEYLVLNGDAFEASVPGRVGEYDAAGFPAATAEASRSFFAALTSRVRVEKLVLVWGNHDFCLQERVEERPSTSQGTVLSLNKGATVRPSAVSFLADFLGVSGGTFDSVQTSYPNFHLLPLKPDSSRYEYGELWTPAGRDPAQDGPLVVFHHGHLLDKLVLGWDSLVDYVALNLLVGGGRPRVSREGTSWDAACATRRFISAMWKLNSRTRAEEWLVLRRLEEKHACGYYPSVPEAVRSLVGPESQGKGLGEQVPWYLTASAPEFPYPPPVSPEQVGYLVVGHDHAGGNAELGLVAGRRWRLLNTGGWTTDRGEARPHSHVVVWGEGEAEPGLYCVST